MSEFVIACVTAIVVFGWGVEQGIILAIILSIVELVRRAYSPRDFLVGVAKDGAPTYVAATAGAESLPGLIVFRFDARLFYANASLFVDDIRKLIDGAPTTGALARPRLLVDRRHRLLGQPQPRGSHQVAAR